jgi:hypothetical protein
MASYQETEARLAKASLVLPVFNWHTNCYANFFFSFCYYYYYYYDNCFKLNIMDKLVNVLILFF